ncbi:MAG: hypothetical protein GW938_08795 [Leptospira sp.]|nr:hypothetical protein [Leptospira sp.]NCS94137.1 hypothetical protein [Leptospira sp.]
MNSKNSNTIQPVSIFDLRSWFLDNLDRKTGIWVILAKKDSDIATISVDDLIDECLCFGWIDSLPNKIDSQFYKLYISPRNPKSKWSLVNKNKVKKLTKEKRIHPNGLKMIQLAKKSGTWDALNDVENLVIPKDLENEFKKYQEAYKNFTNFPKSIRRGILEWILNAKKEETRLKRISETAVLAHKNIRANQYIKK